ncbi:MAG: polyprenol monophosphomannose synthase [Patescibacteria group bacterium]|nr:polyprenol monophosphomannose synthase [Patescibacteria group bacterium]
MKTSIVIATYNEKENIAKLLHDILNLSITDLEIIVVDDNSPDGTATIVENNFRQHPVNLIVRKDTRGYGSAHIAGFLKAIDRGAEIIISMDADFSHQPKIIPEMIREIEAGYDVVVGSRRIAGGQIIGWGITRKLASQTAMILTRLILGIKTRDVTTGFRAYRAKALSGLNLLSIKSNGYSFLEELIYRCEKNHLKIKEVPIIFNDRQLGKSKFSIKEIIKFFVTIIKLRLNIH